jgi:MFS family permease
VAWQVYELTRDPLTLGYVGLAQFLPMVALILPGGDAADRFNRQWIVGFSWLLLIVASMLLLWLTLTHTESARPFYFVLCLLGVARAFAGPAMQSLVPLLVPRDLLAKAIAWNASTFQLALIAGPSMGGVLYLLGAEIAYTLCALLLIAAAAAIFSVRPIRQQHRSPDESTALQRLTAGITYIRSQPIILGALSLDLFAVLLGGATALLPIYASDILAVGPVGLGMLRSSVAVGALVTGIYLGRYSLKRHAGRIMFGSVALFGIATIVFALSESFVLSIVALFLVGASDMVSVFIRATLIQLATPDSMRGRVSAVNMLFIGASNELGEFESGVTAAWFGAVNAAMLGGAGTLAIVAIWMRLFPDLKKTDRLRDVVQHERPML